MIEEEIKKIVSEKLHVEVDEDTSISAAVEDSFAKVEILFEIEQALGVKIPHQEVIDIETVGDLISSIKKSKKK